jgi:hypothetical protein
LGNKRLLGGFSMEAEMDGVRDSQRAGVRRAGGLALALLTGVSILAFGPLPANAIPSVAAVASVDVHEQFVDQVGVQRFRLPVVNTGGEDLRSARVTTPSSYWTISSCSAPANWTVVSTTDSDCVFESAPGPSGDVVNGESTRFTVFPSIEPSSTNEVGDWGVRVNSTETYEDGSAVDAIAATAGDLTTEAFVWEVTDAVIADATVAAGSACPAPNTSAPGGSTKVLVICGTNHGSAAATPDGSSQLSGGLISDPGTFQGGTAIGAGETDVVVGNWVDVAMAHPAKKYRVFPVIGSPDASSPPDAELGRTYEITNVAPVAVDDSYSVDEDESLVVDALTGVLANDTDGNLDELNAVLVDDVDPLEGTLALNADGSFTFNPAAGFSGQATFTYNATDGSLVSAAPATVTITVVEVGGPPVDATASVDVHEQFVDDASQRFRITVANIDASDSILSARITAPGPEWNITSCSAHANWTPVSVSASECTYHSAPGSAGDVAPGGSTRFTVFATTDPSAVNLVGDWGVRVSSVASYHDGSATDATGDLDVEAFVWQVTNAIVADGPVAPGDPCPASDWSAPGGSTQTIVICGTNHGSVGATPDGSSQLGGTYLSATGTFEAGIEIGAGAANVVVANWTDATITPKVNSYFLYPVIASPSASSPLDAGFGRRYQATNVAPVANDDNYGTPMDTPLIVPSGQRVLLNDTDQNLQKLTAVLASGPDPDAGTLVLNANGTFTFTPASGFTGVATFTYRASDGSLQSAPATVSIAVGIV